MPLGKCEVPEIVKLGAIEAIKFEEQGTHCLAYSEEFVDGNDLSKLIHEICRKAPTVRIDDSFYVSAPMCARTVAARVRAS